MIKYSILEYWDPKYEQCVVVRNIALFALNKEFVGRLSMVEHD